MSMIDGPLGSHLSFYPIFIGIIYTIYCQWKFRNVFVDARKFYLFILVYFIVTFTSLLFGLFKYPYYDSILTGPVSQVEKITFLINFLSDMNIHIEAKKLLAFWMVVRPIKQVIFEILYTFL